jgi:hypothetical protein
MLRHLTVALLRITLLVLGLLLLVFYLKLGFFLVPLVIRGAGLAVLATRARWRAARCRPLSIGTVLATYAGITWLAWEVLVDQKAERVVPMRWETRGSTNDYGATEVVLHFVDFPGHLVGDYSDDLAAYLAARQENPVEVTFEVTRDLGWCTRSHRLARVGDLTSWRSAWGYSGSRGDGPSPWRRPWWCP